MTTEHNPLREAIAKRLYAPVAQCLNKANDLETISHQEQEYYRHEADAILELIIGGLDLGSCIVIPVNSDPLAIASLLYRTLPVESWQKVALAILDMRVKKP